MRIMTGLLFTTILLTGCARQASHSGQVRVDDILVTGRHADGTLDFALACTYPRGDVEFTMTNDAEKGTRNKGITFCDSVQDGYWFDGQRASLPAASKFFAVHADGTVAPILLTAAEWVTLTATLTDGRNSDTLPDATLEDKIRAAFKSSD